MIKLAKILCLIAIFCLGTVSCGKSSDDKVTEAKPVQTTNKKITQEIEKSKPATKTIQVPKTETIRPKSNSELTKTQPKVETDEVKRLKLLLEKINDIAKKIDSNYYDEEAKKDPTYDPNYSEWAKVFAECTTIDWFCEYKGESSPLAKEFSDEFQSSKNPYADYLNERPASDSITLARKWLAQKIALVNEKLNKLGF